MLVPAAVFSAIVRVVLAPSANTGGLFVGGGGSSIGGGSSGGGGGSAIPLITTNGKVPDLASAYP